MFGLRKYRLQERQPVGAGFDLVDLESEGIIGVASPGVVETAPRVVETAKRESTWTALVGSLTERLEAIFAPVLGVFFLAGLIFGRASLIPNPDSRPRLILRRPDGGMVLTLRVSSGLLYDSRRVYDGEGRLIAQFRSFKASVRGGFKIIDLRGCEERGGDIGVRPWIGLLESSGDVFDLRLVTSPEAGKITPHASPDVDPPQAGSRENIDSYDIDASSALRQDETGELLLLAAALAVAWRPPHG